MSFTTAQLVDRKRRLGASEAAAAMGLSPYCTPLELWTDKTSRDEPVPIENEFMEWGTRLESAILDKYLQSHNARALEAPAALRVSEKYPWLAATPDAVLSDRLVEIKTASSGREWGEPGTDEIPVAYVVQCTQQMIVCDLTRTDVAVLIAGHDYREYSLVFDEELAKELIDRTWTFWQCVQSNTPPDVRTIADAARRWPRHVAGSLAVADNQMLDVVWQLRKLTEWKKQCETDIDEMGLLLRKYMGDAESLVDDSGNVLATWKTQKRTALDTTTFKQARPELFSEFARTSESRVFRLASE